MKKFNILISIVVLFFFACEDNNETLTPLPSESEFDYYKLVFVADEEQQPIEYAPKMRNINSRVILGGAGYSQVFDSLDNKILTELENECWMTEPTFNIVETSSEIGTFDARNNIRNWKLKFPQSGEVRTPLLQVFEGDSVFFDLEKVGGTFAEVFVTLKTEDDTVQQRLVNGNLNATSISSYAFKAARTMDVRVSFEAELQDQVRLYLDNLIITSSNDSLTSLSDCLPKPIDILDWKIFDNRLEIFTQRERPGVIQIYGSSNRIDWVYLNEIQTSGEQGQQFYQYIFKDKREDGSGS